MNFQIVYVKYFKLFTFEYYSSWLRKQLIEEIENEFKKI